MSERPAPRERLIEAAREILLEGGPEAATTVAIAKRAGLKQPNFYAYFSGLDECLTAAAERMAANLSDANVAAFAKVRAAVIAGQPYRDASRDYHLDLLDRLLGRPRLVALYVQYRHHDSPFGRVMRALEERDIDRMTADLQLFAALAGVPRERMPEIRLIAEILVAGMVAALVAVLENRVADRAAIAELLADNGTAVIQAAFARMRAS